MQRLSFRAKRGISLRPPPSCKRDSSALKRLGMTTEAASIERGAEFEHALTRAFHRRREIEFRGGVEQQDHAVELALAGASGERQPDRVKHRAAAIRYRGLHPVDDLLEAIGADVAAVEDAIGEFADHVARAFAREQRLV